jgi:hypothetical protein
VRGDPPPCAADRRKLFVFVHFVACAAAQFN